MYNNNKILAIIPARGGSKGLPGKNIRPLLGKPLIGWTIEQAKASQYIDELFVSTDSQEIADIAEQFGVKVPSLRPAELSADKSPSSEFIIYTLELLKSEGRNFDIFVLLEPTSPLRDVEDIDKSISMLINNADAESIIGVSKIEDKHPDFLVLLENRFIRSYTNAYSVKRRQDLDDLYFFEGSVYASKVDAYLKNRTFIHKNTLGYVVPKYKSFEVDDIVDFKIIEALMTAKNNSEF